MPLVRDRTSVWDDIHTFVSEGEFDFFFADPTAIDPTILPGKDNTPIDTIRHLEHASTIFKELNAADVSSPETLKNALWDYATKEGRGKVLWPLRYALTGLSKSPDPFIVASIIGMDATVRRIRHAIDCVQSS
jgi:hypothetical protein